MRKILWPIFVILSSFLGGAFAQSIGGGIVSAVAAAVGFSNGVATGTAAAAGNHWTNSIPYEPGIDALGAVSLYSISPNGNWGTVSATRSSDNAAGSPQSIIADNCIAGSDNTSIAHKVWCRYEQGVFTATSVGRQLLNDENSVLNLKSSVIVDPFTPNPTGSTYNLRLDSGTGVGTGGTNVSGALHILDNGAQYNSGIVIGNAAIVTNEAIALATNHKINAYSSAGVVGAVIQFGSGSPAGAVSCTARCLYLRTDGGANTTLYINETGGGTSGWAAK